MTNLTSMGRIAATLSISVSLVLRVADELGIEPELSLDGVRYFPADCVERMRLHIANAHAIEG